MSPKNLIALLGGSMSWWVRMCAEGLNFRNSFLEILKDSSAYGDKYTHLVINFWREVGNSLGPRIVCSLKHILLMIKHAFILVTQELKHWPIRGRNWLDGKRKYLFRYWSTWPLAIFDKGLNVVHPKSAALLTLHQSAAGLRGCVSQSPVGWLLFERCVTSPERKYWHSSITKGCLFGFRLWACLSFPF